MTLHEMEVSTWRQVLESTGKAQTQIKDTTITISEGYMDERKGWIVGEVALVIQSPTFYERRSYIQLNEQTRDHLEQDILSILKRKAGFEGQDPELHFQPI